MASKRVAKRKMAHQPTQAAGDFSPAEYKAMANFGPAIDDEMVDAMEAGAQGFGVERRLTLLALARGAEALSQLSIESPEAFGEMLAGIARFRAHAKALHDSAEAAEMRMQVADCRPATIAQLANSAAS